jgi:plasmid maintenance system antidote protein VapI
MEHHGQEKQHTRRLSLPGEILAELYLAPHEIWIAAFADACGVSRKHMNGMINGHVAITAEVAARRSPPRSAPPRNIG